MTTKERCEAMMLAFTFIDTSKQEGLEVLNNTLKSLSITFEDFKNFIDGLPHNENARFAVYNDVRKFSSEDKGIVRSLVFKAYSQGGKQETDYAVFYFKEIIDECDLANARIQI
jgi:hypothetical protein